MVGQGATRPQDSQAFEVGMALAVRLSTKKNFTAGKSVSFFQERYLKNIFVEIYLQTRIFVVY